MVKNSIILKVSTIFLLIFFTLSSCKESHTTKKELSTNFKKENIIFSEISFNKKSDYQSTNLKNLVLTFKNISYTLKFVEDRTYLQYKLDNKIVTDWQQISYNFNYDSSYEDAEKNIRILYNSGINKGFLLLPGYTEEYPVFNVYSFDKNRITYLENISTDDPNCLGFSKEKIEAIGLGNDTSFRTVNNQKERRCLLKKEKKDDLNTQIFETDIQKIKESTSSIKKLISIPSGEYFATNEQLDDYGISLKIEKDSIIYTESGNMGKLYNQYLLKVDKTVDGKTFLKYSQLMNGYTGDADKLLYFGNIKYNQGQLLFESEYMEKKYGIKNIILKK
ncbi:hypothetical protein EG359_21220 [Chryseobacterium joostei]|uniref:Lipoprotein n=2 Tax=Chryseobacterium joostei TaxID=112234 RepID=A0A1N7ICZ8_9FLAO|nr:hypothetical protein [Chryseobacterium joostei]AZB01954.1 hypothetical protein EG359_21220 [Chryseobacterium joostei]SIS34891.1 hypothetical protein SAMN05421768_104150 [Chryseobacterium joostei]